MTKKNHGSAAPVSVAIALVIVTIVNVWFHSGSIRVEWNETSMTIRTPYWTDKELSYTDVAAVNCRT